MDKYKAQLIAKGFAQTNGIDFLKHILQLLNLHLS